MKVLLIEDNISLIESLQFHFKSENIDYSICNNIKSGLKSMIQGNFDVVILDRMLPDGDGLDLLRAARKAQDNTPVIILTALGDLDNKITGLEAGADDYMVKPFDFRELHARMNSLLRRPRELTLNETYSFGDVEYNTINSTLTKDGTTIQLSKKEAMLFEMLISNAPNTLSRDQMIAKIWGDGSEIENGNLDNHIYFIRKHLKKINSILTIKTVRGIGYMLQKEN